MVQLGTVGLGLALAAAAAAAAVQPVVAQSVWDPHDDAWEPYDDEEDGDICTYVFALPMPFLFVFFAIGIGVASGSIAGAIAASKRVALHRANGQTVDGVCVKRWTTTTRTKNSSASLV